MAEPINLNKVRKAQKSADDKARADRNAIKFGRTKAERLLAAAREEKAVQRLSQLKFEDD